MDLMTNPFKAALRGDKVPLGTWLMTGAPGPTEAIGHCGFDFLVLDMEHVPISITLLPDILRAIATTPAVPLVRLAWNDRVMIKQALDAGAGSIMVPFVENAAEAAEAVASCKYPPFGKRGVAAVHRASRFGAAVDYFGRADDETCLIVQLESSEAVDRMAEIAAVPGVDGVFVGPGDLAASMGYIGQIGHAEVQAKIAEAGRTARDKGIPAGIVGPTPEMVRGFIDMGFSFAAVASDMSFMTTRARQVLGELRRDKAPAQAMSAGASAY
ncbi:HpcH/HpaI aldolase family protein [Paracoccus sp. 22332]|uniref:HpcH/HpaI aldolase family protein n=1 Tax=Paracoccus sp. 22332 TaxID=3453913 RepID=UPI003F86B641